MMYYYTIYETIFPACFFIVATWLCGLGLLGLIGRRPILFWGRISFVLFALFMLPFVVLCIQIVKNGPRNSSFDINEIALMLIPVLLFLFWRITGGWSAVGVSKPVFEQAVTRTAEALKLSTVKGHNWLWCGFVNVTASGERAMLSTVRSELLSQLVKAGPADTRAYLLQIGAGFSLFVAGFAIHYLA